MLKRVLILILMLSVGWQSLSFAKSQSPQLDAENQELHTLLHLQGTAHHHHEDGGIHIDDSIASDLHMLFDGCACVSILPTVIAVESSFIPGHRPRADLSPERLQLFSQGLDRPPKQPC